MQSMIASQQQLIRRSMIANNKDITNNNTNELNHQKTHNSSESLNGSLNETITTNASNSCPQSVETTDNNLSIGSDVSASDVRRSGEKRDKKKRTNNSWLNILNPSYKTRHEEFKRLFFNSVPNNERLVVDYSCALQKEILIHGRVYLSLNYISFYANIFKWETSLVIKCRDITSLTKTNTARVIPNAIQVVTTSGDKYIFTSFGARDKSFVMMFRLWQNALLDQPISAAQLWQWVHYSYGEDLGLTSDDDEEYYSDNIVHTLPIPPKPVGADLSDSCNSSDPDFMAEPEVMKDCVDLNVNPSNCKCGSHEGKAIMDDIFPVSIDRAFELIFTDNKFIHNLHKSRKTYDLKITEWDDTLKEKTRQLSYTVVVTNSIIKSARSVETQRLLENSTPGTDYTIRSEVDNIGVPFCETFSMQTLWCLTRESEDVTRIKVHSRVVFKKNVWGLGLMKSTIEKSSIQGITDFCTDLSQQLHHWLQIERNLGIERGINDLKINAKNIDYMTTDSIVPTIDDVMHTNPNQVLGLTPDPMNRSLFSPNNTFLLKLIILVLILSLFLNYIILSHIWQIENKMIDNTGALTLDDTQLTKNPNYLKQFIDNSIQLIKTIESNLIEIRNKMRNEL